MAKTKTLISFAVTAKLICVFVFVYAKSPFSHNEAHMLNTVKRGNKPRGGRLLVSCVPMREQKKTMRKGTFFNWTVRSAVII